MNWPRWARLILFSCTAWLTVGEPLSAQTVTNAVTGGIGGLNNGTLDGGDGTGSARITLTSVELALVKQARDLDGTVFSDGEGVSPGQEIYFVLYVDNPTDVPASDLRILDQIDESQFRYVSGSLEQSTSVSAADDGVIWAGTWDPVTDALGAPDDGGSVLDTGGPAEPDRLTVGAESGQVNASVSVPGRSIRAFRFRVAVI